MNKGGIKIIHAAGTTAGVEVCKNLLYEMVSKNTALFLSGGATPKTLYQTLAEEEKLKVGAVAMVDERFSKKLHQGSNELMIKNTHLTSYLDKMNIKFYPILNDKNSRETVKDYDETVRFIFNYFQKSVGILGIGEDGHTAGLPVQVQRAEFPSIPSSGPRDKVQNKTDLVTSFVDFPGDFKQRITLTFLGLAELDKIIVLAFGKEKKKALKLMFKEGSVSEVPARFFTQNGIAEKVILVTDQELRV